VINSVNEMRNNGVEVLTGGSGEGSVWKMDGWMENMRIEDIDWQLYSAQHGQYACVMDRSFCVTIQHRLHLEGHQGDVLVAQFTQGSRIKTIGVIEQETFQAKYQDHYSPLSDTSEAETKLDILSPKCKPEKVEGKAG